MGYEGEEPALDLVHLLVTGALDRECGRVGTDPDIDSAHVVDHVMDPVGDRLAAFLVGNTCPVQLCAQSPATH